MTTVPDQPAPGLPPKLALEVSAPTERLPVSPRARRLLPSVVFLTLILLTLGLWRAESRLDATVAGRTPQWVLWGGMGVSVALAVATWQVLWHRDQEQEQAGRHQAALESLNAITTAASEGIEPGPRVLERLVDSARHLLGMSRAGVLLLDDTTNQLKLLAASGDLPESSPEYYALKDLPACRAMLESGEVLIEPDAANSSIPINSETIRFFGVTSLVVIPLHVRSQRIGLLVFSSSRRRHFSLSDRRLAELLGAQAAVILANSQLYEGMRAALAEQRKLLEQRDALAAASAAVYRAANLGAGLARLCTLAAPALEVDLCGVVFFNSEQDYTIAASTPPFDAAVGDRILGPNPLAEEMFRTGEPMHVPDAVNEPRLHESWKKMPDVGAILGVPMFCGNGRPLGALVLVRRAAGRFSDRQIGLAQIFASRAGAAIENGQLLEQTRRDADTRAVLLRELNHRVKNNLAGIVGLLSVGEPHLPLESRKWLARVTERVRAMAAAHELFVGGRDAAPLAGLVDQVVASLAVVKPASVVIEQEIAADALLDARRAVGLAMVLHELCFNALVHGVPDGGTLTIRAQGAGDGRVAVEVLDNGRGWSNVPAPGGSGIGLELVRGLVARELRGEFVLQGRPEGGIAARVEFPAEARGVPDAPAYVHSGENARTESL